MDPDLAVDVVAPALPPASDALVEGWFVDWFFNQGLGVDLYNRIHAAKQDLKARLAGKE